MEPDVIRMFSSSPPPMDEAADDEEDEEFGDFGTFSSVSVSGCSVPNSISFSEFDTPTTFNQTQALNATSPPALNHTSSSSSRAVIGPAEGLKANGHAGGAKNGSNRTETLTNGFQASPTSQKSAPFSQDEEEDFADFAAFSDKAHPADSDETRSGEFDDRNAVNQNQETTKNPNRTETNFANFAAFSNDSKVGTLDDTQSETPCSHRDGDAAAQTHHSVPNRTESEFADFHAFPDDCTLQNHLAGSETAESLSKEDEDPAGDVVFCPEREKTRPNEDCSSLNENAFDASGSVCSSDLASESDSGVENLEGSRPVVTALNGTAEKDKDGGLDGGGSETETETSFGRPLSTEALEEFGDISTTASVASPPLQEETATPTGEEEEEEFGDFGDCLAAQEFSNFEEEQPENTQGLSEDDDFGDFNSSKIKTDDKTEQQSSSHENAQDPQTADEEFEDFGDFNSPKFSVEQTGADFPSSESFGNFSTAAEETEETEDRGWSAFGGEESRGAEAEGESWAAFGSEEATEEPLPAPTATASRSERLEQLFHSSFPQTLTSPSADDETQTTLTHLLEPEPSQTHSSVCVRVWAQLQDIHEALGLRFQWGGSFCNKALLCSLGIDTRNILFTGQKKQPVIVPMYAAGLGMLEPVKPVSAAEMIASIAHNSPCSSDSVQEALPPVQFDWSSSGLTNPLDASGGSSLLNLDFFGPVDDSESGAASIPGVDPELFELTTAKLDQSKVSDAFAKLMSTVQPTTARRPRPEENLSEEALKVISRFPDLSFMTAKVLMFPTTLTPRGVHTGAEAGAGPESGPGSEPGLDHSAD